MFKDVVAQYKHWQPEGVDTFDPFERELEFWHRSRLFACMRWALREIPVPMKELKALDVGCAFGRSTRQLLEFGVKPENILGIDLRPNAVAHAKALNPAIPVRVVEDFENWPVPESFDLCLQCTVFSVIPDAERREALAAMMEKMVPRNGYIFWWDMLHALNFASGDPLNVPGGDPLEPSTLFTRCETVIYRSVCLRPRIEEALKHPFNFGPLTDRLQQVVGYPPSHCFALLRKMK